MTHCSKKLWKGEGNDQKPLTLFIDDPRSKQIVIILLQFLLFAANLNIDIGEDNYEVVSGNAISGTFTVEKELSTDLWVVLTPSPGFEEDIQVFEITSPSGKNFLRLKNCKLVLYLLTVTRIDSLQFICYCLKVHFTDLFKDSTT